MRYQTIFGKYYRNTLTTLSETDYLSLTVNLKHDILVL